MAGGDPPSPKRKGVPIALEIADQWFDRLTNHPR